MKYQRLLVSIVALCSILITGLFTINVYGEPQDGYEKWSRLALMEVKKQFPSRKLTDFEYVKREKINDEKKKDIFKVQVESESERPFIVYIEVTFNEKTEKIHSIEMKKKT